MLTFATRTATTAATASAASATTALARRIIAIVSRHRRRHGCTRRRCRAALFTRGSLLAPDLGLTCRALFARGPLFARRTLVSAAAAATLLASGSLGARGVLFPRGLLVTTGARRTLAAPVGTSVRTRAATSTASFRRAAAAPAAVLALGRFLDRAPRAPSDADPERTGAKPQEPALAFFDGGDHRFGARESQRLETFANRLIERLAFIH